MVWNSPKIQSSGRKRHRPVWNAGFFPVPVLFPVKMNWFLWNSCAIPVKFLRSKQALRLLYSGRNHYDLLVWHSCRTMYFLVSVVIPWWYYLLFLYLCLCPFFSHQWNWFSYQNINFEFEIYMSFACFHLAYFSLVFLTKIEVLWQQFHGWV